MGFFKKLKKRLFTLEAAENNKNKVKNQKLINNKESTKSNLVTQREKKLTEKAKKQNLKQRKKDKRIDKYVAGLKKTGSSFAQRIKEIQARHNEIDEEFFEELEEILIMSDVSVDFVADIIYEIKREVKIENVRDPKLIAEIMADKMFTIYTNQSVVDTTLNIKDNQMNVILIVGVNGSGKTTTIAKIANLLINKGKKVLIAAADTFRAGAVAQLEVWANRVGANIVKAKKENADPASVVFEAVKIGKEQNYDVLIVDTAGRLQNKVNLMNELAKINRILANKIPDAPHESLLVLDATTGQNGVMQARQFKEVTPLTGVILTKMDGTSKGGIVLAIKEKLDLGVKFIGLGEKIDDLQEFDLDAFIYGMIKDLMETRDL